MQILRGKVRRGEDRGKKLGFPTANINLWQFIPEGVYVSNTKIKGKSYPSLTFIGKAETFNETKIQAETHIFNFNTSIYSQWISICLLQKLRNSKKFKSPHELISQMKKDKQQAEKYFERVKIKES